MESGNPPLHEQARFEPRESAIKTESQPSESPHPQSIDSPTPRSSAQPLPSTETSDGTAMAPVPSKKKGTASVAKKAPKRPKSAAPNKISKVKRPAAAGAPPSDEPMEGMSDDEDNGPYCLCRGPDDHRWMICCETCDDWFHGECINLDKSIGESLIEKFVCPNCTTEGLTTIYKKTCALPSCRKPARLALGEQSVFCSNEHSQAWWDRLVSRLPKNRSKSGLSDQLTQDEFMALLNSGLASVGEDGILQLAKIPFQADEPEKMDTDGDATGDPSNPMTEEERAFVDSAASARYQLAQETVLCNHMLTLVELAQKRRRAVIDAGRISEDTCGYDYRLDAISARDVFAEFFKSPEGERILKDKHMGNPPLQEGEDAEDDMARGMCERKRCKAHSGWQKMLPFGIKYQIRELEEQAAEVSDEERVVREAASERGRRKQAERNWVEVIDS